MIDNYNKLPLGKYLDILALPADLPELDYKVKVLAILTGASEDAILDQPLPTTMKQSEAASFLLAPVPKGTGKRMASSYKLGSLELIPAKDVRKWTTAQFVDFQTFMANNDTQVLPELYSCVLVPKGHAYNTGYDVMDVHKAIRDNLPVTDATEISAFFLRQFVRSLRNILISSLPDLKKMNNPKAMELRKHIVALLPSLRNGAGLLT